MVGLVVLILLLSHLLGQRHRGRAAGEPYESGIVSTGALPLRLTARFYLLALLFVVFDLEVAFLVAWAVAARDLGWSGYAAASLFALVLGLALVYLWRLGALEWGTRARGRIPGTTRPAGGTARGAAGAAARGSAEGAVR